MKRASEPDEFAELRAFALALAQFVDEKYRAAGGLSYAESLAEGFDQDEKQVRPSLRRQGAKMAVGDLLEMTRDIRDEVLMQADAWLAARGVASLTVMRERIWQQVPKLLARGRIRDDAEYYLLIERLNDVGPTGLHREDRELAGQLVAEYERRRAV